MTPLGLRKKISFSFLLFFCIWFWGLQWFVQQVPQTKTNLPETSDDAIIALTGGGGRLEYGLQLLAENKGKVLFISGVGEKVTIADILHQAPSDTRKKINDSNIILGHQAENTIGNAEEIKQWLQTSNYKKIILVTSNYHIPRSLLELSTAIPEIAITPAPVIANDNELLLSEYHKYIASKLRHLFVSATQNK
jgi:uncharacterized SAM-binding protein YcdF (DUF218 family)